MRPRRRHKAHPARRLRGTPVDVSPAGAAERAPPGRLRRAGHAGPGEDGAVADSARTYDVVVYGATGFVGRLLAGYLAEHAPPEARIALAGRSRERLQEVRDSLPPAAHAWAVLTADSSDRPALDSLAAADARAGDDGRALRPLRDAGRRGLRAGGHPLRRPHRRGAVRARRDRPGRRGRPGDGRPHRARLRVRLDPVGPLRPAARRARPARRRRRAARRPAGRHPPRRVQRRDDRLDARAARGGAAGSGAAPGGRRPVRAEPRPVRRALHPPAAGRRPAGAHPRRPVDGAVRHGAVQHPDRAAQQRAAGLGVRAGPPLRRGDGLRPRPRRRGDGGRRHRGAGRHAGRHGVPADPRAARPLPARARGRPGREDPGVRAGSA